MKNKCWYNLNIDISNSLNKDWVFGDNLYITFPKPYQIFNSIWLTYMESLHLPIKEVAVFYKNKYFHDPFAHIDIGSNRESLLFGLNWVYGGEGSKMIWYNFPENFSTEGNIKETPLGGIFCSVNVTDSLKIDERIIDRRPVLVRVNMPHRIEMGSEPRWCVSARLTLPQNNWEDLTKDLLSKNLIS